MRNLGFRYEIGDLVTHIGFLKPMRQPVVQQFQVVSRVLVAGPSVPHRFYYVQPAQQRAESLHIGREAFRIQEEHLAPLPEDM
jgi:hypothetical protein